MLDIAATFDINIDIDKGLRPSLLQMKMAMGNSNAHRIRLNVQRDGKKIDLSGVGVNGYCMRSDGTTVPLKGNVEDGSAILILTDACYAVPGVMRISLNLSYGDTVATYMLATAMVEAAYTDMVVDPDDVLPSLPELLGQIAAMEQANAAARAAAQAAHQAAQDANTAAQGAAQAGQEAVKIASEASQPAIAAGQEATQSAKEAAQSAKEAAETLVSVHETVAKETVQAVETINARETAAVGAVEAKGVASVQAVQDAAEAAGNRQQGLIEAKGAETLETIPGDYATLYQSVVSLGFTVENGMLCMTYNE